MLAIFNRTKPIAIYTDASGVGIGAVWKQRQADGIEKLVAYFSCKLSNAQCKKKAIYIEALAIREAVRYWKYWLIGRHFTIICNHKLLQHLNLKACPDEEHGDLANKLLQFNFDVLYCPGSQNHKTDCLSCNPVLKPSPACSSETLLRSFHFLSLADVKLLQVNVSPRPTDKISHNIVYCRIHGRQQILINKLAGERLVSIVHSRYSHVGSKQILLIYKILLFWAWTHMFLLFACHVPYVYKIKLAVHIRLLKWVALAPHQLLFNLCRLTLLVALVTTTPPYVISTCWSITSPVTLTSFALRQWFPTFMKWGTT